MECLTSSRRSFVQFFGRSTAALAATHLTSQKLLAAPLSKTKGKVALKGIRPTSADEVVLAEGLSAQVLLTQGQVINAKGERFGDCNDFIAFLPDKKEASAALLWINHEAFTPFALHGFGDFDKRGKEAIAKERQAVGGSIVEIRRTGKDGQWSVVLDSARNRRLSAETSIPFANGVEIRGSKVAEGTLANCSGGVTPWETVLTCEENYQEFYGEVVFGPGKGERRRGKPSALGWENHFDLPPEHYGWVVEVDLRTGEAKKHTSLGRFAHEAATTVKAKDGRTVVYMGDDAKDQCIYKFVSDKAGSLESGTLYVANLESGKWLPLDRQSDPRLKEAFADHTDLMIRTREAALMVGGTRCDRPEDIEVDPQTGVVIVALTNNSDKGNHHGSLLKIQEAGSDCRSLTFRSSTLLLGGDAGGFSCPDNLAFDRRGNLWVTSDMSSSKLGKGPYRSFGNNGIFVIPFSGPKAGKAVQVASAPVEAEFTGPCFSADGKTLFISVQHPGEESKSEAVLSSHWPEGKSAVPRSAVIAVSGPLLDALVS